MVDASAENGFLPEFDKIDDATWKRMSVVYLCSPANPQGAIASMDYLQKLLRLCRKHDAVLALDECYAEIYTGQPPAGGLEAALAMDETGGKDPFRNLVVFHSLSKRSNAAGLRSGFVAGDPKLVAMILRWRTYGGPQIPVRRPEGLRCAMARGNASDRDTRMVSRGTSGSPSRSCTTASATIRRAAAFFLWLDVGDGVEATRTAVGARRTSRCCREPTPAARPMASTRRDRYIRVALVHDEQTTREGTDSRLAAVL